MNFRRLFLLGAVATLALSCVKSVEPGIYTTQGGFVRVFVDSLGAIAVSFLILHSAWKIIKPTLQELSEAGVSHEDQAKIYRMAASLPGVLGAHALRTRNAGGAIWADIHLIVDPDMTVREGHDLSHKVRDLLVDSSDLNIADVVVHLEPPTSSRMKAMTQRGIPTVPPPRDPRDTTDF